ENSNEVFEKLRKEWRNGCILFEDLRSYASATGNMPHSLRKVMIASKQMGCDIYAAFHSWSQVIRQLHTFADVYVVFDHNDIIEPINELKDIYTELENVCDKVKEKAKESPFFFSFFIRSKTYINDKDGK
ncbi:MAG TPA: hypothetical protein VK890_08645, partial [Bacteroidia bacterium]|nr:hypothetical protein [Bacteroidia bacterium]